MSTCTSSWRRVVSGDAHGPMAGLARGALSVLSVPYGWAMSLRDMATSGDAVSVGVPTISVGNLTAGGTGKTPVVSLLVTELLKRGRRPVVLARGYGPRVGETGREMNDEGHLLARRHPGLLQIQGRDRVALARHAAGAQLGDVLVLDDGYQHTALHRDLNVCCLDATNPFGHGAVLPRGLLREPLSALYRARPVLITRAELASAEMIADLKAEVLRWNPYATFVTSEMRATALTDVNGGSKASPSELSGRRVLCVSGVGNPDAFAADVRLQGARVSGQMDFDDHHAWTQADVAAVVARAKELAAEIVVTTSKDAVKLASLRWPDDAPPLRVLEVEAAITDGAETWAKLIDEALAAR